jgi:HlyD family secretion protein
MMKKTKFILLSAPLIFLGLSLSACRHKNDVDAHANSSKVKVIAVQAKPYSNMLYFSGFFEPLNKTPVTSPVAGTVIEQMFLPGSYVKKGELLFKIKAGAGENSAASNLASFLKAKDSLNTARNTMQNSDVLYKGGLLARNQYESDISNYYSQSLAYEQARQALEKSLVAYHDLGDVYDLTLSDMSQVKTIMDALAQQQVVSIYAPAAGVALLNSSNAGGDDSGSDDDSDPGSSNGVQIGSDVKLNGVLVTIGQPHSFAINVNVNEINIEQVAVGQKATITNVALPKLSLTGYVKNVSAQASNSDALPSFAVTIVVPKLSAAFQSKLHFGMSAKAAIDVEHPARIVVPLNAVMQTAGNTSVKILNKQTGKTNLVPVVTGETTQDSVVILSGLKAGDQIVVPD